MLIRLHAQRKSRDQIYIMVVSGTAICWQMIGNRVAALKKL